MTGHPLLVVLGLVATGGQDSTPAAAVHASYRAVAALDEPARLLRGTVQIRLSLAAGDTLTFIELATGSAHVGAVSVNGVAVNPAANGQGLRVGLPMRLVAGDSLLLEAGFVSAAQTPSASAPAAARHFDFRSWLPRVAGPGGRPPAPGTFLVTLDVPSDQVIGATGWPLCGDPGWTAARQPPRRPVTLGSETYAAAAGGARAVSLPSDACQAQGSGRKRIVWYAEDVRDVALVMDPDFRYEEGDVLERPVRGLYLSGDERSWGAGVAVRGAETALAWLHELFDSPKPLDYPWPQTTVVHDPDGDAVDPMLVRVTSPGSEAIAREVGRLYTGVAVAVVPADEPWLDRGLTRFQADLYLETQGHRTYRRLEREMLDEELDGRARPVLPARARSPEIDSAAAQRSEFLLYQLRAVTGDATMRGILRAYWARARLRSADESLFVAVVDSIAGGGLGECFAASLGDAATVDYAVGGVVREPLPDGRWRTTIEVLRRGGGHFPLAVRVEGPSDTVTARAGGVAQRETVTVETAWPPVRILLDPAGISHDWNVLNNQRTFGFRLSRDAPSAALLDPYFTRPSRRDRLARSWAPVAWYNDAGGWTVGFRRRDDYLGRFDLDELWVDFATGLRAARPRRDLDARVVLRNPTWLRSPGLSERLELTRVEGRAAAALGVEKTSGHGAAGLSVAWVGATTSAYLDPSRYERAGTLELTATGRAAWGGQLARAQVAASLAGGYGARRDTASGRGSGDAYARATASALVERTSGALHLRARATAGAALARGPLLRQRRIYLAGADPYELLADPFLRSRGALLVSAGVHYHAPGGAGLRGFSPGLGARQAYGLGLELERDLARRGSGLANRLAVAAFADGAVADGDLDPAGRLAGAADAGVGVRMDHRIGATSFQTRFDFPLWVSRPLLAQDTRPGRHRLGLRWTFSFAPAF